MADERRPTLRQEQQADTRRRLLRAAREAFIESGFSATTIDRIVESANTSRATFYLHFRNKTEALLATWGELDLPEVESLFRTYDEGGDFTASAAQAWMADVVRYWEERGRIGRTALQALALEPELEQVWVGGMSRAVDDMPQFRRALGDGELARAIVLNNVIELERVLYFWVNDVLPTEREFLVAALARNWTASVTSPSTD